MERPSLLGTWAFASSTACSLRRCSHRREDKQNKGLTGEWAHTDIRYPTVPWPLSPAQGRHSRRKLRGHTLPRQGPPRRHSGGGGGARHGPGSPGWGSGEGRGALRQGSAVGARRGGSGPGARSAAPRRACCTAQNGRTAWSPRPLRPTLTQRRLGQAARQRSGDPQLPVPL